MFGSLRFIVGEGGVAVLYFSYRLIQFPLGVFSNAFSQAILPTLSTQVLEEEGEKLKDTLLFGLRMTFLVLLPATVLFIVLSEPIIRVIFQGGRFDAYSTRMTSDALSCYSIGLCAYGATKILQQCFFALKDTVTPAKISALALVVNIILNVMLMFPLKLSGLALATSLSGINTFCILLFILRKRLKSFRLKPLVVSFGRMLIASIGMGLICYFISRTVIFPGRGIVVGGLTVGLPIIAGLVSYICFCFTFNVTELHELLAWCKKKKVA